MNLTTIKESKHSYYGTGNMFVEYSSFNEFYTEMANSDIDINLCYRFDFGFEDEENDKSLNIFTIQQRKGRIVQHFIKEFKDDDIPYLEKYLKPHYEMVKSLFSPFTFS
jgi:hypothetical protein